MNDVVAQRKVDRDVERNADKSACVSVYTAFYKYWRKIIQVIKLNNHGEIIKTLENYYLTSNLIFDPRKQFLPIDIVYSRSLSYENQKF